jgi:hypothetical protein
MVQGWNNELMGQCASTARGSKPRSVAAAACWACPVHPRSLMAAVVCNFFGTQRCHMVVLMETREVQSRPQLDIWFPAQPVQLARQC